jgi:hypothetical protein
MKCLVEVYNYLRNESEWLQGEIIGRRSRIDITELGYDVKLIDGRVYEACHPICVKVV